MHECRFMPAGAVRKVISFYTQKSPLCGSGVHGRRSFVYIRHFLRGSWAGRECTDK